MTLRNLLFILLLVPLVSCSTFFKKKTERVLARVNDDYLYESDIKGLLSPGATPTDSINMVKTYVETWVHNRLLVSQARNNLPDSMLDFTDQLAEYENSLIIYAYENALVDQKLDTIVTPEEVEAYYDSNQQNFLLKENIVKLQYVKLPNGSRQIQQVKRLLASDSPTSLTQLSELCEKEAADYYLDNDNWVTFSEVIKQVPLRSYNEEEFLRSNQHFEYRDSSYVYILRIREFKIKDNISPLAFEENRIRDIILNKRKIDLINNMRRDVYDAAVKKNDFEIY